LIAADASSLIAYFEGQVRPDTEAIDTAMAAFELVLPPPVVPELIGRAGAVTTPYDELAKNAPQLPLNDGYWLRARALRSLVRSQGLRARTMDTLIAQCCIDADVALITRDDDFRQFARWGGLKLAP
jgi:predicted nucleic acid-binding protein